MKGFLIGLVVVLVQLLDQSPLTYAYPNGNIGTWLNDARTENLITSDKNVKSSPGIETINQIGVIINVLQGGELYSGHGISAVSGPDSNVHKSPNVLSKDKLPTTKFGESSPQVKTINDIGVVINLLEGGKLYSGQRISPVSKPVSNVRALPVLSKDALPTRKFSKSSPQMKTTNDIGFVINVLEGGKVYLGYEVPPGSSVLELPTALSKDSLPIHKLGNGSSQTGVVNDIGTVVNVLKGETLYLVHTVLPK